MKNPDEMLHRVEALRDENRILRRRLDALCGTVSDAVIMVDPDLRVNDVNKATEGICGLTVKDLRGRIFQDASSLCSRKCHRALAETIAKQIAVSGYRIECAHVACHYQVAGINSSPIFDDAGNLVGAVMVVRDMTPISDLHKQLKARHRFHNMVGRSAKMQALYTLLENLANLDAPVLLTGERGSGRALAARALHYEGRRALQPFVAVDCAALAENQLGIELFGQARGAIPGSAKAKIGRIEAADGGTLFLDGIGDMPPRIQRKLLQVLQDKTVTRMDDTALRNVDVRLIACSDRDLEHSAAGGVFREDLYRQFKSLQVSLPPLRERLEDLPLLVDHFITVFNQRLDQAIEGVSQEVLRLFMAYPWPGNVGELARALEHAVILCPGPLITPVHLPGDIVTAVASGDLAWPAVPSRRRRVSVDAIRAALEKSGGNKARAARMLGINRRTLYRKLAAHE